jgi:methyltransferase-like protein
MIKVEVNTLLSADKLAELVAKQVQGNPLALQQALVKVFSVSTNPTTASVFKDTAKAELDKFISTTGKDLISQIVQTYLKTAINVEKLEKEAIKSLTSNVDGYFAAVFNRVVVTSEAGTVIGKLGFKEGTTLKAPMPKNPLPKPEQKVEDIPF